MWRARALSLATMVVATTLAHSQDVQLHLRSASDLEIGCFDPCACPVMIHSPMTGTMRMILTEQSPNERRYDVRDVDWMVTTGNGPLSVTGTGSYHQVIDTVARHRMILDLSLGGDDPVRFDSGLDTQPPVPVPLGPGLGFVLNIVVARHEQFCWDTVFTVLATEKTAHVDDPRVFFRLETARPSPFHDRVDLAFTLSLADRIELAVFEASGRRVRTLIPGSWRDAGPYSVAWDGTDDRGRPVAAGVLFVRLRTSRGTDRTTLVRVR
jgi:hypothetical protein